MVIDQYIVGNVSKIKTVTATSRSDLEKLHSYIKKLKPLEGNEKVKLALLREIEIQYNDYITVGIQLEEQDYCYYSNSKTKVSGICKMSKGLYNLVTEILSENE